jgi:hypothetical protein
VLIAPVVRYPLPGDLIPLPIAMNSQVTEYLDSIVAQRLSKEGVFVLMGIDSFATREYTSWLSGRLRSSGFTSRLLGVYGGIQVTVFECQV